MRLLVMAGLSLNIAVAVIDVSARAQTAPEFESASVKPSQRANVRGSTFQFLPGGGLRVQNGTLKGLIESAYDLRDFQIFGTSGWMTSDPYDLVAKSPSTDARLADLDNIRETRVRLRALLADRFRLKVHRERRDLPEYSLHVATKGVKLTAGPTTGDSLLPRGGIQTSCCRMIGTRASMAQLSMMLSRQLSRPVLNRTALDGTYTFQLEWTPDSGPCSTGDVATDVVPTIAPSIFTAIEEQLGLKLESIKGPVDVVVVDHAETPSPD